MGVNAFSIPFSMKKSDKVPGGFRRLAGISRLSLVMTRPHGALVTDSAASGTALATGEVTRRGMISQDPEGRSRETLMERARKGGFLTGIITDTRITHATPAVFYSHIHDRNREGEIALQLVKGGPDLFLGGGAAYFIPQGTRLEDAVPGRRWKGTSRRKDKRNLLDELTRRGRNLVFTGKELKQAAGLPLGGFFASSHLPYAADRQGERDVPGLDEMTARALDLMADTGRPFFLVIECGRIDHAAHANDMGTLVHAMAEMDRVLMVLAPLVEQNTGNLALVVTSDHETGGPVITSFRGKEPVETALPDGRRVREWERSPHPADLEKYLDQEASREEILKGSGSPDELYENFRETMPYPLTRQEAQKVYELWKNRNR
jgi:alkaline phosphatase